ncbi:MULTISPECIES: alcohol dehydrogenase catalytic domain-containing protein [unclassified Actinoplanes]|uniref:alcohol dehydrogenase catalytic domain-containing protein n=1 Tax=unclassified Actinoplanes TaxID=2626549 RepID=UPI0002F243A5|nr:MULTISPECIES: alcohol dehydrogenase catalytic domain-containing protein [unclassified Actinoplanes]
MQALVFDRPAPDTSATRVANIDRPTPGRGQVSIEVAFAGINFKDVMARRGDPGYAPRWPFTPGLEVSGTVSSSDPASHVHAWETGSSR